MTLDVRATSAAPESSDADAICVGLFAGEPLDPRVAPPALRALVEAGGADATFKALTATHADGRAWLLVGLGERAALTPERLRVAAAVACRRLSETRATSACWIAPDGAAGDELAAALVEGTALAAYRFAGFKRADERARPLEQLVVASESDRSAAVEKAALVAAAVNAARDLQNRPANDLTPTAFGEAARQLAAEVDGLEAEVEGPADLARRGMDAFAAVARGSVEEPRLIVLRYAGAGEESPVLGLVGKGVTLDSGGISLKPDEHLFGTWFDMSGGAAVLQATALIARLRLSVNVVAVIGATENLPSGSAMRPGDVVTAMNGTTIQITNTDAEGRLVLADCLAHCVALGAERIVDVATLTGGVRTALGTTHAGLMSNDDALSAQLTAAGERTGELVWRLPLHEEYDALIRGLHTDLDNQGRPGAVPIKGAQFLSHFVDGRPWAHLDMANSSRDLGRAYAEEGASGWGVRLLLELARMHAGEVATAR